VNLEELAMDRIRQTVYAKYKGHGLARLVGAVLEAQGYRVAISPAGADGGVDVIAGTGPLGFGAPKLVAQVKSDQGPVDVRVVRELQGVMKQFGADHGLVVAWGGFNSAVQKETARQFFEIRLWTGNDLMQQLHAKYDSLPADLRAELPLKRIWTLAGADETAPA
jgi:restriction system protein